MKSDDMTPKELAETIYKIVKSDPARDMFDDIAEIALLIGHEKQEWNRRCNEACEKQVNKAHDAAIEQAAKIFDDDGGYKCLPDCDSYGHNELCPVASPENAIRALKK